MIKTTAREPNEEAMAKLRGIQLATAEIDRQITKDAASLVRSMQAVHGGVWRVQVDHDAGFVLVCRH